MRIFVLGGTGRIGRAVGKILAEDREVSELAIAARDSALAKRVSKEIGPKAAAVEADALDEHRLSRVVEPYDLFVNVAGPDFRVALPAIRAAIAAGTHYCDIAADGPSTERALALDGKAKEAGVTVLTGIGHVPGESNLLMRHAANQFDAVDSVRFCMWLGLSRETYAMMGDPAEMRRSGRVNASWQTILAWVSGRVRAYQERQWVDLSPFERPLNVALPGGRTVQAYPVGSTEPITLPAHVPGVQTVEVFLGLDPPQLGELLRRQARRVAAGEADAANAAMSFLETVESAPDTWLTGGGIPPGFGTLAWAVGWKGDRKFRYSCWPAGAWESTVGALTVAARRVLRGEIRERGVLPPEAIFDPISFLQEAAQFGHEPARPGQLLDESLAAVD